METFLTGFAIVAVVVATLGVGCFAIGLTWLLGKRKSVTTVDKAVIAWLFYNAVIHFTLVSCMGIKDEGDVDAHLLGGFIFVLLFDWHSEWSKWSLGRCVYVTLLTNFKCT